MSSLLGVGSAVLLPGHTLPTGDVGTAVPSVLPVNFNCSLPWEISSSAANVSTGAAHQQLQVSSLYNQFLARSDHHPDMFLAPAAVPLGEKVLCIVDFMSSLVPKETEQTLSELGGGALNLLFLIGSNNMVSQGPPLGDSQRG